MSTPQFGPCPPRFVDLKKEIAAGREDGLVQSWRAVLKELEGATEEIARRGNDVGGFTAMVCSCVRWEAHGGWCGL